MTETICPVCSKAMKTNICDNCKYDSTKEFPTELEKLEYAYALMDNLTVYSKIKIAVFILLFFVVFLLGLLPWFDYFIRLNGDYEPFWYIKFLKSNYLGIIVWAIILFSVIARLVYLYGRTHSKDVTFKLKELKKQIHNLKRHQLQATLMSDTDNLTSETISAHLRRLEHEYYLASNNYVFPIKPILLFSFLYLLICIVFLYFAVKERYPLYDSDIYYFTLHFRSHTIYYVWAIAIWVAGFCIICYFQRHTKETKERLHVIKENRNLLIDLKRDIENEHRLAEKRKAEEEKRKAEEEKRKAEEERKMIELEKEKRTHEEINEIVRINGRPDKIYRYNPDNRFVFNKDTDIIVFGQSKKLMMFGQTYDFKDILGCTLADNKYIVHGKTHSATTVSSWDRLLSLANTIAGDENWQNQIIGTAQRNTVTVRGNDHEVHDITICVNVNSLANPIVNIHIGNDTLLANEMAALFNVIVNQK